MRRAGGVPRLCWSGSNAVQLTKQLAEGVVTRQGEQAREAFPEHIHLSLSEKADYNGRSGLVRHEASQDPNPDHTSSCRSLAGDVWKIRHLNRRQCHIGTISTQVCLTCTGRRVGGGAMSEQRQAPYREDPAAVANALIEGRTCGRTSTGSALDCPYTVDLHPFERVAWHRGFSIGRSER